MDFGTTLKQYRKKKNLTQEKLSAISGVSTMSIRRYEKGERVPTLETIIKLIPPLGQEFKEAMYEFIIENWQNLFGNFFEDPINKEIAIDMREEIIQGARELLKNNKSRRKVTEKEIIDMANVEIKPRFDAAFEKLNDTGKLVAVDRVEELTEIKRYTRKEKESE